jgi:tyrosinase
MPFWDWARFPGAGQPAVPTQIRDQQVTVTKPSGQVTIANPLYSYSFGSSLPVEMNGGPWNNWPATLRRPVANPTRSNNNEMNNKFQNIRINLRDRLFGLFSTRVSFGLVSTSALGARTAQNGNNPDSIESIHDVVHSTIGGESGGHMWYLDLSAFDPIFWLHHTNIDRLLAMYQVITPDTWVATGKVSRNMAQWNAGETKDADSPLKPFTKNAKGDYYTSNDIKNTRVLGYVYPETNGNPNANSMMAAVNSLYGPGSPSKKRDTNGQYEGRPFREGDYNTVLSVIGNKYAVEGSYTVHCFLGQPSSNSTANSTAPFPLGNSTTPDMPISSSTPSNSTSPYSNSTETYDFTQDPNYVGVYAIAGGSMGGPDAQKVMTEGSLPLTTALQGKEASGELKSLHPDDVEEYLKHNLHYKVIVTGNIEVPADSIPDLHISVKSCKVTPAASPDQLPVYSGNYAILPKATEGKPAGQPFVYTPTPAEVITLGKGEPGHTTETTPANGTMVFPAPDAEPGYCVSKQVVMYVDPNGQFLYQEES